MLKFCFDRSSWLCTWTMWHQTTGLWTQSKFPSYAPTRNLCFEHLIQILRQTPLLIWFIFPLSVGQVSLCLHFIWNNTLCGDSGRWNRGYVSFLFGFWNFTGIFLHLKRKKVSMWFWKTFTCSVCWQWLRCVSRVQSLCLDIGRRVQ